MFSRMKFCKLLGKLQEPYVPVDFRQYKDIYVFCDSDPIGYYLSWKKYIIMPWRMAWIVSGIMIRPDMITGDISV